KRAKHARPTVRVHGGPRPLARASTHPTGRQRMDAFSRRTLLQGAAAVGGVLATRAASAGPLHHAGRHPGWVFGRMTGAQALTEALILEGTGCVYGIPGAQGNELWDTFKSKKLPYLLVTHEYSAACMADGYARSTGKPGV